jgi:hypothetical protein
MQAGAPDINEKVPILAELLDGTELGQDCDQTILSHGWCPVWAPSAMQTAFWYINSSHRSRTLRTSG